MTDLVRYCHCEHSEEEHGESGECHVPHCPCLQFVADTDDPLDELNFDEDGA